MTLFVQLYESSPEAVKSEVATFFEAFPEGLIFGNTFEGHAIDTVLVGQAEPPEIWLDDIEDALRSPAFAPVDSSLGEIGPLRRSGSVRQLRGPRARPGRRGCRRADQSRPRSAAAVSGGLGVNLHEGDDIYREILHTAAFRTICSSRRRARSRLKAAMEGMRE